MTFRPVPGYVKGSREAAEAIQYATYHSQPTEVPSNAELLQYLHPSDNARLQWVRETAPTILADLDWLAGRCPWLESQVPLNNEAVRNVRTVLDEVTRRLPMWERFESEWHSYYRIESPWGLHSRRADWLLADEDPATAPYVLLRRRGPVAIALDLISDFNAWLTVAARNRGIVRDAAKLSESELTQLRFETMPQANETPLIKENKATPGNDTPPAPADASGSDTSEKSKETPGNDTPPPREPDGPFGINGFRFAGKEVQFGRAALQFGLVKSLWDAKARQIASPRQISEVIEDVWGHDHDTADATFRQMVADTNKKFQIANCPIKIQAAQGSVQLVAL